jgi:hypothetical protein
MYTLIALSIFRSKETHDNEVSIVRPPSSMHRERFVKAPPS